MKTDNKKLDLLHFIPGFLIGLFFAYFIFQAMAWGPWAYNDSSAYVSAARNFAQGNGSVIQHATGKIKRLTEFPPFYPFFLSLFGGLDGNYIAITRVVNSVLFAVSIFIFYSILLTISQNSLISSTITLLFASFGPIIQIFTGAMSETLFLPLLFLMWFFLILYLKGRRNLLTFSLLTIFSALLPITRYAGIVFNGVIFIILMLDQTKSLRKRIAFSTTFLVISYSPIAFWSISLLNDFGKFAGKNFGFGWGIFRAFFESFKILISVIGDWMPYAKEYPGSWKIIIAQTFLAITVLLVIAISVYWFFKEKNKQTNFKTTFYLSTNLSLVAYIALVIFMRATSSPQIDIINRTLLPLFPLILISITQIISRLLSSPRFNKLLIAAGITLSAFIVRYNHQTNIEYINNLHTNGIGYTARQFVESGIIEALEELDENRITISNLSGFVLFHTNKFPILIENFPNYRYGEGNAYGEKGFREDDAALILFK